MNDGWSSLSVEELDYAGVFNNVAPEAVNGLLQSCPIKSYGINDILLEKGQIINTFFVILKGKFQVCIEEGDESLPPIYLSQGETIGEMSVIESSATSALVKAIEFSQVLCIPSEMFWRLIDVSHAFSKNMLLLLAGRMRHNDSIIQASIDLKSHLEEQTTLDPLTTLNNRRWIDLNLPRIINRARFGNQDLTILMLDIDHFKGVNDTYGHLVGDAVLQTVAKTVRDSIRPSDFACRYGGEEFLVVFPDTSLDNSEIPAERIRTNVERITREVSEKENIPAVTISGGLACVCEDITEMSTLIKVADDKLYHSKENGRNQFTT